MEIYQNYNIGKVFSLIEQGISTPELEYINAYIADYIKETKATIFDYMIHAPKGTRATVMKWISDNVASDLQYYVQCEYLGKTYNVLEKNGKWKTLADIGIDVVERKNDTGELATKWLEDIKEKAELLSFTKRIVYESHAHYDLCVYDDVRDELLELLKKAGIKKCVIPAISYKSIEGTINLLDKPEYNWLRYTVGSHPKYISREKNDWTGERWKEFRNHLKNKKCCAVGEIGLDYSYAGFSEEDKKYQEEMFIKFIEEANKAHLPAVLHIRPMDGREKVLYNVHKDALRILKKHPLKYGAILHCFGEGADIMYGYMAAGVNYFGIGGRITYMMEELEKAVIQMPIECLILETDSPYICLEGYKKPNTSLSLYDIAEKIAKLRGDSVEHILGESNNNFMSLYKFDKI